MTALRRSYSAARRLMARLADDFPTTAALLLLRISLPLLKRAVPVKRLVAWLSARPANETTTIRAERIRYACETLERGGQLLIGRNCLDRSLAGFWMLRRAGASPTLVLGAKRGEGPIAGHAWLEIDNNPLDPSADEFIPIASFGGGQTPLPQASNPIR